jgi:hypothetical protein
LHKKTVALLPLLVTVQSRTNKDDLTTKVKESQNLHFNASLSKPSMEFKAKAAGLPPDINERRSTT